MKKSPTPPLGPQLFRAVRSACAQKSRGRFEQAPEMIGHRQTAAAELQLFAQAWSMSTGQAINVLVFVRSWLHNLTLGGSLASYDLTPDEVEALKTHAKWLDGIPQVVKRLPDAVLLEDPVCVQLRNPSTLPPSVANAVADLSSSGKLITSSGDDTSVKGVDIFVSKPKSNAKRRTDQERQGSSFVKPPVSLRPPRGHAKGSHSESSTGRR